MVISRTPFRISFGGGGTDIRDFYRHAGGAVLSTTIDKYIYVTVKRQIGIVEHKYRISWSRIEFKDRIDDIEHPIVREALRLLEIDYPIEITTFADVPAFTGLGSSSAFAVGLLNALLAQQGRRMTKIEMALLAGRIEIDILGRNIGLQDHMAAACGGLNEFRFHADDTVAVESVVFRPEVKEIIERNLLIFFTGIKRDASDVLAAQKASITDRMSVLGRMRDQVDALKEVLVARNDLSRFGRILHEGWQMKKSMSPTITSPWIDGFYDRALQAGAVGGKLLGAGGGGFLLFYVEPQNQAAVIRSLSELYHLPFRFEDEGSQIVYFNPSTVA